MATPFSRPVLAFPVEWSAFQVTGQPFTLDSSNPPAPIVPLEATAYAWFGEVFTDGLRAHGIPIRAHETIYLNHYVYSRTVIDEPTPEEALAIERALRDVIAVQMDRWLGEFRPRAEVLIAALKAFDADSPELEEVRARLDALDDAQAELWAIHFRIVIGMLLSMQGFGEFYAEVFDAPEQEAFGMLAGGVTESMKVAFAIADLADQARELGVDSVILQSPDGTVMTDLAAAPGGDRFLAELHTFLDRYGYRQDNYRITTPTWIERPSRAIAQVRACLRGDVDARARQARVASEANAAADRARQRIAAYPQQVRDQFEALLAAARQGAFLEEEHHFYIDQHSAALMRLTWLKVGKRLVREGMLDEPEDVLMLEASDLRAILLDPADARASDRPRTLVRERQRELEIAAAMTPPPVLGDPSGMGEPPDNPISRALRNHFGGPPVPSERHGELRGMPASHGVVTGRARVARSLEEAQLLQRGEILVATTTTPPWTPLFGVAAAVVAETGGVLSHCAISAREYGIPAVVGVYGATREIPDGATVAVDGAAGTVAIVE